MARNKNNLKVVVGLSGGVDSAVSAHLLIEQGYDVTGIYMQCWDEKADGCTAAEDRADAAKVASHLGIKFKSLNFIDTYKEKVIELFYDGFAAGKTPNPDVLCNKEIKFGIFLDWAIKEGFDHVATGHYSRVRKRVIDGNVEFELLTGVDLKKDQSYFLYLLGQKQLSKTLFPLGEIKKIKVRKLAKKFGFHNAEKKDSVGICFIGEVDIREFLKKRIDLKKGNVVNKDGKVVGEHDGVSFYTIGQRHGFKITKYHGLPMYVIRKNVDRNELVVGFAKDGLRDFFEIEELHWIGSLPKSGKKYHVRIRHLGDMNKCVFEFEGSKGSVKLKDPIFGVAPGQSAVIYDGKKVLGGGYIV